VVRVCPRRFYSYPSPGFGWLARPLGGSACPASAGLRARTYMSALRNWFGSWFSRPAVGGAPFSLVLSEGAAGRGAASI